MLETWAADKTLSSYVDAQASLESLAAAGKVKAESGNIHKFAKNGAYSIDERAVIILAAGRSNCSLEDTVKHYNQLISNPSTKEQALIHLAQEAVPGKPHSAAVNNFVLLEEKYPNTDAKVLASLLVLCDADIHQTTSNLNNEYLRVEASSKSSDPYLIASVQLLNSNLENRSPFTETRSR